MGIQKYTDIFQHLTPVDVHFSFLSPDTIRGPPIPSQNPDLWAKQTTCEHQHQHSISITREPSSSPSTSTCHCNSRNAAETVHASSRIASVGSRAHANGIEAGADQTPNQPHHDAEPRRTRATAMQPPKQLCASLSESAHLQRTKLLPHSHRGPSTKPYNATTKGFPGTARAASTNASSAGSLHLHIATMGSRTGNGPERAFLRLARWLCSSSRELCYSRATSRMLPLANKPRSA